MQIDLQAIGLNQAMLDQLASGYQDFGPQTPFSDWRNAANELARESEEEVAERALSLYNEVDPGRGRAMGGSTRDLAYKEIVQEPRAESWMDTYKREGLSPYKVDSTTGEKVYINTPAGVNLIDLLEGKDKQEYLAKKEAGFDERLTNTPYNVETGLYGSGAGDYGTRVIPETPSKLQEVLSSPVASILSSFIPGGAALLTAGKVLSGSGKDIGLMEAAGAVAGTARLAGTPTATAVADNIEFAASVASGDPVLAVLNKGTDLVDEDGEVIGRTTLGRKYTTEALDKVGLNADTLSEEYNINQDDLVEGLVKTEKELVKGSSLDEALLQGLGTYVREGGSLGGFPDLPDLPDLGIVLETPELLKKAEDVVKEVGSVVDDVVLQPPRELVEAIAEATPSPTVIEDIAREVGSTTEDVVRAAGAVIDEPVQAIKEAAEAIYEPLESPDLPSLEAPDLPSLEISTDVDLPSVDVDIPSVDLDIPSPSIGLAISQPQPTKSVTESLFEDFLFEKKYQAPELIARTVPLAQYTAPQGMFRNIV